MLAALGKFTGTQRPPSLGRSFTRLCQVFKCVPGVWNVLTRAPDCGARRGRPSEGCGRWRQPPLPRYPGHCAVVSSNCPAVPRPPAAAFAGLAGWRLGTSGPVSLVLWLQLAAPAPSGSLGAVPAPGRPQAMEGSCASARAAGLGGCSEIYLLHHLSSGLRKKRKPPFFSTFRPSKQNPARPRALGASERRGEPFRICGPSRAARSHPHPGLQ